ncbi:hypothetical protein B8133_13000 [Salmonella enterica]|uniref:Uncharacterized protein n=1 Tax=Salmonella enterica TaxID=28901 RepID=A0A747SD87_SALER|nr:hypothetical protein [Salmonella enterica]HAF4687131.1 hypothetical protein [Salmonella enterica]
MTWGCRRYTKNFLRGVEKTPPRRRMQERAAADWRTFDNASRYLTAETKAATPTLRLFPFSL